MGSCNNTGADRRELVITTPKDIRAPSPLFPCLSRLSLFVSSSLRFMFFISSSVVRAAPGNEKAGRRFAVLTSRSTAIC